VKHGKQFVNTTLLVGENVPIHIVLGPPGTGKTTYLLNQMESYLEKGIHPSKIGFISFTRKAAYEGRDRAISRFNLLEEETPYFRTLHSLAFRQLGWSHNRLMQKENYSEIANQLGIEFTTSVDFNEGSSSGALPGDNLIFIEGLSRLRRVSLRQQWEEMNDDRVDWFELQQVAESINNYKKGNSLYDFTDILSQCYEEGSLPNLDVLFVDEAQDLSPLQWLLIERLASNSGITYLAGDDDQAIFAWAGADVAHFINMPGDRLVLAQSYRIPQVVHIQATSISYNIIKRSEKIFKPRDSIGTLTYHPDVEDIDLSSGEWLCLARSRRQLYQYELICKQEGYHYALFDKSPVMSDEYKAIQSYRFLQKGIDIRVDSAKNMLSLCSKTEVKSLKNIDDESLVSYSWLCINCNLPKDNLDWSVTLDKMFIDDIDYFNTAFTNGENLDNKPRVRLSTIHGVKGGEADNVAIISDVYSRVYDGMQSNPDDEHRVFYVGVTRAKESLHIVTPRTPRFYEL
jgi:DNA helicase-2/ATP-dependent DNA helicase PcrA